MTTPPDPDDRLVAALAARAERGRPRGAAATLAAARSAADTAVVPSSPATDARGRRWATVAAAALVLGAVGGGLWFAGRDDRDGTRSTGASVLCEQLAGPLGTRSSQPAPDVYLYARPGATQAEIAELAGQLEQDAAVATVRYVDTDATYERFRELFAEQDTMLESVEPGDLPTSFELLLEAGSERTEVTERYQAMAERRPTIYEVQENVLAGATVLDGLVWPGHNAQAQLGPTVLTPGGYGDDWPTRVAATASAARAEGDADLADAIELAAASLEQRVAEPPEPEDTAEAALIAATATIEAAARARCDQVPLAAFTVSLLPGSGTATTAPGD